MNRKQEARGGGPNQPQDLGSAIGKIIRDFQTNEAPIHDAFQARLFTSLDLYRDGDLTDQQLFDNIIGDGTPFKTSMPVRELNGDFVEFEITEDRKIKLTVPESGSNPMIEGIIGLSDEGRIVVEQSTEHIEGTITPIKGDFIYTLFFEHLNSWEEPQSQASEGTNFDDEIAQTLVILQERLERVQKLTGKVSFPILPRLENATPEDNLKTLQFLIDAYSEVIDHLDSGKPLATQGEE